MTQNYDPNFDIYTEPWGTTGNKLNDFFKTIFSLNAGEVAPPNAFSGMPWLDVSAGWANAVLKFYNGSNWVSAIEYNSYTKDLKLAKGSKNTLWERLEVALNEDGTLKSEQAENMTEWVDSALTATYVSATEFSVEGDQTDIFVANRKIKATLSGNIVYSAISSSSYVSTGVITTVTLNDSVLDNTLQKIEYGFIKPGDSGSLPKILESTYAENAGNADTLDGYDSTEIMKDMNIQVEDTDWNTITESGIYRCSSVENLSSSLNQPDGEYGYGLLLVFSNGGSYVTQIYCTHHSLLPNMWFRLRWSSADWRPWQKLMTNSNEVGFVKWFVAPDLPSGYLECNGAYLSKTTFSDLFSVIGIRYGESGDNFRLPDLRGEFVRGWNKGRVLGSTQGDAMQNIIGNFNTASEKNDVYSDQTDGVFRATYAGETKIFETGTNGYANKSFSFDASRVARTASETRSRNVALLPCIKY